MELYWTARELGLGTESFLFMSGGAITESATAFTAAHRARILSKPLDLTRLRVALSDITDGTKAPYQRPPEPLMASSARIASSASTASR